MFFEKIYFLSNKFNSWKCLKNAYLPQYEVKNNYNHSREVNNLLLSTFSKQNFNEAQRALGASKYLLVTKQ